MKKQYYSKMKKRVGDGNQYKLEVTECRKLMRELKTSGKNQWLAELGTVKII